MAATIPAEVKDRASFFGMIQLKWLDPVEVGGAPVHCGYIWVYHGNIMEDIVGIFHGNI